MASAAESISAADVSDDDEVDSDAEEAEIWKVTGRSFETNICVLIKYFH